MRRLIRIVSFIFVRIWYGLFPLAWFSRRLPDRQRPLLAKAWLWKIGNARIKAAGHNECYVSFRMGKTCVYNRRFYWDAPYGFVLSRLHRGRVERLGCIGFEVEDSRVTVRQLQGMWGQQDILKNMRWERLLLSLVFEWAAWCGFSEVRVQKAKNNKYYNDERAKKFHLRYDVTARRCGFREMNGDYFVKRIEGNAAAT